jgi:threonine synthase
MPVPLRRPGEAVTLGECNTPIVAMPSAAQAAGVERLYGKLEFASPTGSFKDRGAAMMMSAAVEHGVTEVVEDSSGNAGAAVSAYAAHAGISAHIFAPSSAPPAKLRQISVYGATLHTIEGPREATTAAAMRFAESHDIVYASHALSPFFLEGMKGFAYEVADQFPGRMLDHVVFPVGNGSLLIGAYMGFSELAARGSLSRIPALHAVQSEAVSPVVAAFHGRPWSKAEGAQTVAGGISVAEPPQLHRMVQALRATGGNAIAVKDGEILRWQRLLAEKEGIFAESSAAAALAGLEALVTRGAIGHSDTVLWPATGFGLKESPAS